MYYVYILKSKTRKLLYIGFTDNLNKRMQEYNQGKSFTTKKYRPWELCYLEGYKNGQDAKDRERKLKQFGKVYSQLKRRIKSGLNL
ncbi:MAG TPA: GIY-YIG nuclease family protein [Patescibacteria group bacterium]|nr:GIY-YIG nuclease family protein [Patescibacteria group bacterium]